MVGGDDDEVVSILDDGTVSTPERWRVQQEGQAKLQSRQQELDQAKAEYDRQSLEIRQYAKQLKQQAWLQYMSEMRRIENKYRERPKRNSRGQR